MKTLLLSLVALFVAARGACDLVAAAGWAGLGFVVVLLAIAIAACTGAIAVHRTLSRARRGGNSGSVNGSGVLLPTSVSRGARGHL